MITAKDLDQLRKLLDGNNLKIWEPEGTATEPDIVEVEELTGIKLPEPYRSWLKTYNGGECFGDVDGLTFAYASTYSPGLIDLNAPNGEYPTQIKLMSGIVFIGCDDGLLWFIEPRNLFGQGTDAVYWIDKGSAGAASAYLVAPTFLQFMELMLNNQSISDGTPVYKLGPVPDLINGGYLDPETYMPREH